MYTYTDGPFYFIFINSPRESRRRKHSIKCDNLARDLTLPKRRIFHIHQLERFSVIKMPRPDKHLSVPPNG